MKIKTLKQIIECLPDDLEILVGNKDLNGTAAKFQHEDISIVTASPLGFASQYGDIQPYSVQTSDPLKQDIYLLISINTEICGKIINKKGIS